MSSDFGYMYIGENIDRALLDLVSKKPFRERIADAVVNLHRFNNTDYYMKYLSPEAREAWNAMMGNKTFSDLTDEEFEEVAKHVALFISQASLDIAPHFLRE